jgi:hypothetical protein
MNNFGLCLEFGIGREANLVGAAEMYKSSANANHSGGQANYGFCLEHGLGIEIDLSAAAAYYKKSTDHGDSSGAFHYALCLHYGIGLEIDLESAAHYYEISAKATRVSDRCHSFRSRRSQCRASFSFNLVSVGSLLQLQILEECKSIRSFCTSFLFSDYIAPSLSSHRIRLIEASELGEICLARNPADGPRVAVHCSSHNDFGGMWFKRNFQVYATLNHPCILRILGVARPTESTLAEIHTEYAEYESLENVLARVRRGSIPVFWNPTGKCIIICGIVLGMLSLHRHRVMHQSLRPDTIVINSLGRAHILGLGDFLIKPWVTIESEVSW